MATVLTFYPYEVVVCWVNKQEFYTYLQSTSKEEEPVRPIADRKAIGTPLPSPVGGNAMKTIIAYVIYLEAYSGRLCSRNQSR